MKERSASAHRRKRFSTNSPLSLSSLAVLISTKTDSGVAGVVVALLHESLAAREGSSHARAVLLADEGSVARHVGADGGVVSGVLDLGVGAVDSRGRQRSETKRKDCLSPRELTSRCRRGRS